MTGSGPLPRAYVEAAPGRMSGEVCIGGTRITTATFRALRDDRGLNVEQMNALYPHLTREQVEVALWWEDHGTEPPEPTGRWVVEDGAGGERPVWDDGYGHHWPLVTFDQIDVRALDRAEAALVDLIEREQRARLSRPSCSSSVPFTDDCGADREAT